MRALRRWLQDEEGQGLTEYALILVLISIIAIVALDNVGGTHTSVMEEVTNTLDGVSS